MKNRLENDELDDRMLEQLVSEAYEEAPSVEDTESEWRKFRHKYILKDRHRHIWTKVSAVAVICSIVFVLGLALYDSSDSEIEVFTAVRSIDKLMTFEKNGNVYVSTPAATQTRFVMEDGTKVVLDANSSIVYPEHFSGDVRRVHLTGRARFEVESDSVHPFVVVSENMEVRAIGTVFDVKSFSGIKPSVALFRGKVMVKELKYNRQCVLSPGQSVFVDSYNIISLDKIDDGKPVGWSDNKFVFDNVPLLDVMKEIGAWYNVNIECSVPELLDRRIYFNISRDVSLESVILMLNDMSIVSFRIEDNLILVRKKR